MVSKGFIGPGIRGVGLDHIILVMFGRAEGVWRIDKGWAWHI